MRTWTFPAWVLLATALAASKTTWTFEDDAAGAAPKGFTTAVGAWTVEAADGGKVLAQTASNADPVFNLLLADGPRAKDLDLSVKLRAVAGELDRGGGVVWRARDAKNYYIARFNHLEDNFRVYKVVDGVRSPPLATADVKHHDGWTTLRVTMDGDHIACYLDGIKRLDARDATFPDAGKVGLWSKSDARSRFDDLTLVGD